VDPYTITAAAVSGDELRITLTYGGGCREHRFRLVASDAFMESYPVQVAAVLTHDANGDQCRALRHDTLRFDLTPLKEAYRRAYQAQSGVIVLRLWYVEEGIRYEF
jgi:hypothetical protein